ncbi:MAG: MutS-related protein, partial [Niabella sp.]
MPHTIYSDLLSKYTEKANQLRQKLNRLSIFRLIAFGLFLVLGYFATQTGSWLFINGTIICLVLFFIIVKWFDKTEQQTVYYKALAKFNQDEIAFLKNNHSSYSNGKEYEDAHHPYSYDLDIFGEGGLFSYINRSSTGFGKKALANALLHPDVKNIVERQTAIKELKDKVHFRQQLYAQGSLHESKEKDLKALMDWSTGSGTYIHKALYYALMVLPAITIGSLIYYFGTDSDWAFRIFYMSFILNLLIAFSFAKKISSQLSVSTSVNKILQSYKEQLRLIEKENFQSALLKKYQQDLSDENQQASTLLSNLASLFEYLETIINLLVSVLLNGLFLFHIHILYRLGNWKKNHGHKINNWLKTIGEIEALNSFANLYYNNPHFCIPQTTGRPALQGKALGHVLLRKEKRICNDVSFNQQQFIILTGSNMSGKSTFLRTLGINLVLARSGSVVCAEDFSFYPFDVFVSMRITDSLQDSESFFYAELKRLQAIIQHLQAGHTTFVILDEILRGTNSNDKRNGTIGLIRKLAKENTVGIIATHDVVVADLKNEYPNYIANKAFESQIINDELLFDYKLKDGVCTTLSASYLMKKLG